MEHPAPRKTGRPLSFDRDAALEKAMLLFWKHGYEGTSLNDLTTALGVTPPSIYAAFGDKKRLFLAAVARYCTQPATAQSIIDAAPTAYDAATRLLYGAASHFTGETTPAGCLLATSAISCSAAASNVQAHLAAIRQETEAYLATKIRTDITIGRLPPTADPDTLAALTIATIQGLSTLARDGAPREKLHRIATQALRAWPV